MGQVAREGPNFSIVIIVIVCCDVLVACDAVISSVSIRVCLIELVDAFTTCKCCSSGFA